MLSLLGVSPGPPLTEYDSTGVIDYLEASDAFSLEATPTNFYEMGGSTATGLYFPGASVTINIQVDDGGVLLDGAGGFVVTGDLDTNGDFVPDYSGTLLTGNVTGLGFEDSGSTTDRFDFHVEVTGGELASGFTEFAVGSSVGVYCTSEGSTFTGVFDVDFQGGAKGEFGPIEPLGEPGIDIEKLINGEDADTPLEAVEVLPGEAIEYCYEVTNTGELDFAFDDVVVTDDQGLVPVFDAASDDGGDLILSPGETWVYTATATAEDLGVVIDFDTADGIPLPAGTIIDTEFQADGLTLSTDAPYGLMIFNSAHPTGHDCDLKTPGWGVGNRAARGNILIISEDGDQSDPDDNAAGGTIFFDFDLPVRVDHVSVLDIDCGESGGEIVTFDADGNVISVRPILVLGNNSHQIIEVADEGVSRMEVRLIGSGAVTEVAYSGTFANIGTVVADTVTDSDAAHYVNGMEEPPDELDIFISTQTRARTEDGTCMGASDVVSTTVNGKLFDGSILRHPWFRCDPNLDGFHMLADGSMLLSTARATAIDGTVLRDGSVARFYGEEYVNRGGDPAKLGSAEVVVNEMQLYGRRRGGLDVDSISVAENGDLLISLAENEVLADGNYYRDGDVIRLELASNGTLVGTSLFLSESIFCGCFADIDAFHALSDTRVLLSVRSGGTRLGDLVLRDGDIVLYDMETGLAEIKVSEEDLFCRNENIDALFAGAGNGELRFVDL